jgi:hypothetical protein
MRPSHSSKHLAATARRRGLMIGDSSAVGASDARRTASRRYRGWSVLRPGQRIELSVQVGAANTFRLAAINRIENENANPAAQAREVEVKGFVTSSTTTQIVVNANGTMLTFVAPAGGTLPVLPTGTFVEVRGLNNNGVITLTRLRTDDNDGGGASGGSGDDGGHGGSGGGGDGGH